MSDLDRVLLNIRAASKRDRENELRREQMFDRVYSNMCDRDMQRECGLEMEHEIQTSDDA